MTQRDPYRFVYLDEMGHLWSADREKLHSFARSINLKPEWFQDRPVLYHYDLTTYTKRAYARASGAVTITSREMVGLMRNAVLRS